MTTQRIVTLLFPLIASLGANAQESASESFDGHTAKVQQQLDETNSELQTLIEQIKNEKLPLNRKLNELQSELIELRASYQSVSRTLARRKLDLASLRNDIDKRQEHATHVSTVLGEFGRNLQSRLHIAELPRYEDRLQAAELAPSNSNLSNLETYTRQTVVLDLALEQINASLGGSSFTGTAVTEDGLVREGTFVLFGPAAIFRSKDGKFVGTAEQRLGSLEPTQVPFGDPEVAASAAQLVLQGKGAFPLDPTLGNAHKMEATQESFAEHVQAGGLVMIPIFAMAGLALLVALYKYISFLFVRTPSRKRFAALLECVRSHDTEGAEKAASKMSGPLGEMMRAGVEHLEEPRELVEEVMYESVLKARLQLNSLLPFIAICAASAPLLGLLGTVTGIINTFKLLTVFGSGDVSNLSGGISEALITTKFGLIVAIPSLLIHAFLSRKARGVLAQMESSAVAFANEVSKSPFEKARYQHSPAGGSLSLPEEPSSASVRTQVRDVLTDMFTSSFDGDPGDKTVSKQLS